MIPLLKINILILFSWVILPIVVAQTVTVADPDVAGNSIVEVVTLDDNGLPSTLILQTITSGGNRGPGGGANTATQTTTSPTATTATTAAAVGPGPVAQPAPTVPVGQGTTSYQYTTTNALGETTVIQDVFTPTYNVLPSPPAPSVGTVLPFNQWTALIGTNTVGSPTNAATSWRISSSTVGGIMMVMSGVMAGALVVV